MTTYGDRCSPNRRVICLYVSVFMSVEVVLVINDEHGVMDRVQKLKLRHLLVMCGTQQVEQYLEFLM